MTKTIILDVGADIANINDIVNIWVILAKTFAKFPSISLSNGINLLLTSFDIIKPNKPQHRPKILIISKTAKVKYFDIM